MRDAVPIRSRVDKILVGISAFVVVALLIYALATGSPFAVGALFFLVGFVVSYLLVHFATRSVRPRRTLAGRLIQGYVLIAIIVLGFGVFAALPNLLGVERATSGFFIEGAGYGITFAALFRLILPVNSRARSEQVGATNFENEGFEGSAPR